MSSPCSIESCPRVSSISCNTCNKRLCPEHSKEHDEYFTSQFPPLAENIRDLSNRYALINPKKLLTTSREQLNQWRNDSHKTIDRMYQEKSEELKRDWPQRLTQPQKDLDRIRAKNLQLIRQEKTTHEQFEQLREAIRYIDQQIKDIEQNGIQIDIQPISFEKKPDPIPIHQVEAKLSNDLIDLSIPYRAIDCSNQSGVSFTGNQQSLLIYEHRTLSLLDQNLHSMEQSTWIHGHIIDMCWSTTLNNFILITDKKTIYQVNENPFRFKPIQSMPQEQWWSCTCSDHHLFLLTHGTEPFIFQFHLQSSFETIKYWRSPLTCKQHQFIQNIRYVNQSLGLIIIDSMDKTAKFELRSAENLKQLWSFTIEVANLSYQPTIHSCLIQNRQWIIFVENTSQMYHLDQQGTLISIYEYKPPVWNALLFATNILAIRTQNKIIFHQI